jgi:hypothetical protein
MWSLFHQKHMTSRATVEEQRDLRRRMLERQDRQRIGTNAWAGKTQYATIGSTDGRAFSNFVQTNPQTSEGCVAAGLFCDSYSHS